MRLAVAYRQCSTNGLSPQCRHYSEWASIPVSDEVKGLCELYGFEAMDCQRRHFHPRRPQRHRVRCARDHATLWPLCTHAIIGTVSDELAGKVCKNALE